MQNDAATLYCPNDPCQASNRQTDKFCQLCGTPLIKRYLWAVGEGIEAYNLGDLVAKRYLLKSNRIFLDTKPGLLPNTRSLEISNAIKPYLRLVTYGLHIPQVYDLIPQGVGRTAGDILLLEQAPIYTDAVPLFGQLMPELTSAWKDATSMRQLNWLWQMAQLWQPLSTEGVASSLLNPQLLRVEGSLMRLLQLQPDLGSAPTLSELGSVWSQLATFGRPGIAGFLEQLCLCLKQGEVQTAEQLIAILDRALAEVARSLVPNTLRIATRTDQGPSRQRNEDACYPPSGNTITKPPEEAEPLAIVCDGIGGHEGGNVASNLAIETIQQQVQQLLLDDACLDATTISSELESSVRAANDTISQRNDNEHRHGRQRMGTTLVMALARAHEIYIAHVGDSRAYWITRTGCHQVTLDDDVASREVRLGYALYRDALQQASSGSLVQALGMSSSASLYPTVQRFVLDEDCVFLLCTDGLSDYDRVEQCWETEILPILDGKVDVATAGARLVEIANTQNGHDNVTVGLVYCQVSSCDPASTLSPSLADLATVSSTSSSRAAATVLQDANTPEPANPASTLNTQLLPSQGARRRFFVPLLLGLVVLLTLGGGLLAYLSKQEKLPRLVSAGSSPINMQSPGSSTSKAAETPVPNSASVIALQVGTLIQLKSPIQLDQTEKRPNQAGATLIKEPLTLRGSVPADSILKVVEKINEDQEQGVLLKLEIICLTPSTGNSDALRNAQPGQNNTPVSPSKVRSSPASSAPELASANSHPLQRQQELLILEKTLLPKVMKTLKPSQVSECSAFTTPDAPAKQEPNSEQN